MSKEIKMSIDTNILTLVLGNAAVILPLFLWNRSEARADIRHMDAKLESTRELVRAIHDEVKDFHERLYELEKNRGK